MNNNLRNACFVFIFIYIVYIIYEDYKYHKQHKNEYVLCLDDYEQHLDNYSNSELFNKYNNLSTDDQKFISDFIIYTTLKHKKGRPKINKTVDSLKKDVVLASIVSGVSSLSFLTVFLSMQQNILHHITRRIF
jgi:hypothetical protein